MLVLLLTNNFCSSIDGINTVPCVHLKSNPWFLTSSF